MALLDLGHAFLGNTDARLQGIQISHGEHHVVGPHQIALFHIAYHDNAVDGGTHVGVLQLKVRLLQIDLGILHLLRGVLELLLTHQLPLVQGLGAFVCCLSPFEADLCLIDLQPQLPLFQLKENRALSNLISFFRDQPLHQALCACHNLHPALRLEAGVCLDVAGHLRTHDGLGLDRNGCRFGGASARTSRAPIPPLAPGLPGAAGGLLFVAAARQHQHTDGEEGTKASCPAPAGSTPMLRHSHVPLVVARGGARLGRKCG